MKSARPRYTADLAAATIDLLRTGVPGLYHLTNTGQCSRFDFAAAIFELAGMKVELTPITSREFAAPARRPAYAVLAMDAAARLGLPPLRPGANALAAYLEERKGRDRR